MMKNDIIHKYSNFKRMLPSADITNALTDAEIKQTEKAIGELYKICLMLKKDSFKTFLSKEFNNVRFDEFTIFIGDYSLCKNPKCSLYLYNPYSLIQVKKRLEDIEIDKLIYTVIAGILYDKKVNIYVEMLNNIKANALDKQQRFQELLINYKLDKINVYFRKYNMFKAAITSRDGRFVRLYMKESLKVLY